MKSIVYLFLMGFLFVSVSCNKTGENPAPLFGIKEMPKININLLSITPSNLFIEVNKTTMFNASGGHEPYIFSLISGAGSITPDGQYTAPSYQSNSVIKVVDDNGKEAYATITVNVPITMTPSSVSIANNNSVSFSASGGVPPYSFSIVMGGGSINSSSGAFNPTSITSGTSIVRAMDSAGGTAFSTVTVNLSLLISPATKDVGKNETLQFTTTGGTLPYSYSIISGSGTITTSGLFTAPSSTGVSFIRVSDGNGLTTDSVITTVNKPRIITDTSSVSVTGNLQASALDGTPPYAFSILAGGGSINSTTGVFTAPAISGSVTVRVTDSNGYTDDTNVQVFIPSIVAPGLYHTCSLIFSSPTSSKVKCWGTTMIDGDNYGMLSTSAPHYFIGDNPNEMGDVLEYVNLGSGVTIRGFTMGRYSVCAVTTSNELKCWGYNSLGTLFRGDTKTVGDYPDNMGDRLVSVNLGGARTVHPSLSVNKAVSVYDGTACVILDDNTVKCWGSGVVGVRGSGNVATYGSAATHTGDALPPVNLGAMTPVQVAVGASHACVLSSTGNVKCWGSGTFGATGYESVAHRADTPTNTPNTYGFINLGTGLTAKQISTGYYHTCAVLNNDSIKCWGHNQYGQLGAGTTGHIGNSPGSMGNALSPVNLGTGRTAIKVETSIYSSCAILDNNQIKCWGYNIYGQLGQGHTSTIGLASTDMGDNLPYVDLGTNRHAVDIYRMEYGYCAKLDNAQIKCWGFNQRANLGVGHIFDIGKSAFSLGDNLLPVNLGTDGTIEKIEGGGYAACGLISNGKIKCWGMAYSGGRGDENIAVGDAPDEMGANLEVVDPGLGDYFVDIKSYQAVTCGKTQKNQLICWGSNEYGNLGIGSYFFQGVSPSSAGDNFSRVDLGTGLTVKDYSVGSEHSCAILNDDSVKCWGRNQYGQLGLGHTGTRGPSPALIGNNLLPSNLGTIGKPVKISTGNFHSCALFDNGRIKCWGYNQYGELGYENTTTRGTTAASLGDNLPFVDLGTGKTATSVCTGYQSTCALLSDKTVKCWGSAGRNGAGVSTHIGDEPGEMGNNLSPVNLGSNFVPVQLSCGASHNCVVNEQGAVKCFGYELNGRLGNGSTSTNWIGDSTTELGNALMSVNLGTGIKVVKVFNGYYHTCALLSNSKIKCWGHNQFGQLGQGHLNDMGASSITLGDNLPYTEVD